MPGTHCYVPQCKNRSNGNVITDHFRAKKAAIHKRQTRFALRHYQDTSSNKNQIFVFLFDTLAVQLLSPSFAFSFCKLQLSYLPIYFNRPRNSFFFVVANFCYKVHDQVAKQILWYSRTPLIRPPSESHCCGRIRGMVAREGFIYFAWLQ